MKIVHVISGYLPDDTGGTQMQVRDLCHAQRSRGHDVHVFARTAGSEHDELSLSRDSWEDVPVTRLTNNFLDCDRFELLYSHPVIDRRFDAFLADEQPDVVHIHHLTCLSTSMIEVAKKRGIPVVMTLQDYWMVCPRGQRLHPVDGTICEDLDRSRCLPCLRSLWPHLLPRSAGLLRGRFEPSMRKLLRWESHIRRMLDLCDTLVTPSEFHRDRFVEFGVQANRCRVVANGVAADHLLAPPRDDAPIHHIGFIGSVLPSKGVHVLIDAFSRLGRRDLELHIHGETPPFHEKTDYLDQLLTSVVPGLTVEFHGRYENRDLASILAKIDLLVVPALWWESFCITAREGALAGLPVIVSDLGGLTEAVSQGLALGSPPGDAEALAVAIARVCDDAELRRALTRKAHLVQRIQDTAAEIEQIYGRLLPA